MFIFEKGKLLYRLPYFSARPLTVKVEEKTNFNNSVEGARLCHDYLVHFASVALSYALWNLTLTKKLLVKDKIAVPCATNTLPSVISNFKNNKNELWKTVGLTIFHKPTLSIRFNLPVQVCPSESSFIIAVLLVHSFIMFLVFIFAVFYQIQFAAVFNPGRFFASLTRNTLLWRKMKWSWSHTDAKK